MPNKKQKKILMCGTNTDVGKTYITNLIIKKIMYQRRVGAYKPIESGCNKKRGSLVPNDAKIYFDTLKGQLPLDIINPYRFQPPISPRRAIKLARKKIYNKDLTSHLINFANYDYLFIEGAGGICSPLTLDGLNIDVMKKIGGDAILVAKDEIGVINNVLLSISKLRLYKISILAIVLNKIQPVQPQGMNNKRELEEFTDIPIIQFVNKKKNKTALDSLAKLII